MDIEKLTALLEGFDLAAMLPDLQTILDKLVLVARICLLAGPAILVILGLWYLVLPPREANHKAGFRTFWGMSSVESWRFTQLVAGILWTILGIVMLVVVDKRCDTLLVLEPMTMLMECVKLLIEELIVVFASRVLINIIIFVVYNIKGELRQIFRKKADRTPKTPRRSPAQRRPSPKKAADQEAPKESDQT